MIGCCMVWVCFQLCVKCWLVVECIVVGMDDLVQCMCVDIVLLICYYGFLYLKMEMLCLSFIIVLFYIDYCVICFVQVIFDCVEVYFEFCCDCVLFDFVDLVLLEYFCCMFVD